MKNTENTTSQSVALSKDVMQEKLAYLRANEKKSSSKTKRVSLESIVEISQGCLSNTTTIGTQYFTTTINLRGGTHTILSSDRRVNISQEMAYKVKDFVYAELARTGYLPNTAEVDNFISKVNR